MRSAGQGEGRRAESAGHTKNAEARRRACAMDARNGKCGGRLHRKPDGSNGGHGGHGGPNKDLRAQVEEKWRKVEEVATMIEQEK